MPKFTKLEDAMNWTDTAGGWTIQTAGPVYWSTDDEDVAILLVSFLTDGDLVRAAAVVNHEATADDDTPLIDRGFIDKFVPLPAVGASSEVHKVVQGLMVEVAALTQQAVVLTQRLAELERQLEGGR